MVDDRLKPFTLRTAPVTIDGIDLLVCELNARDLIAIWATLAKAEQTGDMTDAYLRVVSRGLLDTENARMFPLEKDVGELPARIVVALAERILALSEVELDPAGDPTPPPDP